MKFEIVVPDSTPPETLAKLADLTAFLSDQPERVDLIDLSDSAKARIMFTPEIMSKIREAETRMNDGKGVSLEEVDALIAGARDNWVQRKQA